MSSWFDQLDLKSVQEQISNASKAAKNLEVFNLDAMAEQEEEQERLRILEEEEECEEESSDNDDDDGNGDNDDDDDDDTEDDLLDNKREDRHSGHSEVDFDDLTAPRKIESAAFTAAAAAAETETYNNFKGNNNIMGENISRNTAIKESSAVGRGIHNTPQLVVDNNEQQQSQQHQQQDSNRSTGRMSKSNSGFFGSSESSPMNKAAAATAPNENCDSTVSNLIRKTNSRDSLAAAQPNSQFQYPSPANNPTAKTHTHKAQSTGSSSSSFFGHVFNLDAMAQNEEMGAIEEQEQDVLLQEEGQNEDGEEVFTYILPAKVLANTNLSEEEEVEGGDNGTMSTKRKIVSLIGSADMSNSDGNTELYDNAVDSANIALDMSSTPMKDYSVAPDSTIRRIKGNSKKERRKQKKEEKKTLDFFGLGDAIVDDDVTTNSKDGTNTMDWNNIAVGGSGGKKGKKGKKNRPARVGNDIISPLPPIPPPPPSSAFSAEDGTGGDNNANNTAIQKSFQSQLLSVSTNDEDITSVSSSGHSSKGGRLNMNSEGGARFIDSSGSFVPQRLSVGLSHSGGMNGLTFFDNVDKEVDLKEDPILKQVTENKTLAPEERKSAAASKMSAEKSKALSLIASFRKERAEMQRKAMEEEAQQAADVAAVNGGVSGDVSNYRSGGTAPGKDSGSDLWSLLAVSRAEPKLSLTEQYLSLENYCLDWYIALCQCSDSMGCSGVSSYVSRFPTCRSVLQILWKAFLLVLWVVAFVLFACRRASVYVLPVMTFVGLKLLSLVEKSLDYVFPNRQSRNAEIIEGSGGNSSTDSSSSNSHKFISTAAWNAFKERVVIFGQYLWRLIGRRNGLVFFGLAIIAFSYAAFFAEYEAKDGIKDISMGQSTVEKMVKPSAHLSPETGLADPNIKLRLPSATAAAASNDGREGYDGDATQHEEPAVTTAVDALVDAAVDVAAKTVKSVASAVFSRQQEQLSVSEDQAEPETKELKEHQEEPDEDDSVAVVVAKRALRGVAHAFLKL